MKSKLLKYLLISIVCSVFGTCKNENSSSINSIVNQNEVVDVVLIAGQSNAEGNSFWAYLDEGIKEYYRIGFENTQIRYNCCLGLNESKLIKKVTLGQGNNAMKFGPEIGMAEYFEENYEYLNRKIYLVKYAIGGTMVYNRWRSPTEASDIIGVGDLYSGLLEYVEETKKVMNIKGLEPNLKAICWMQGESDAFETAHLYQELENSLINDFQKDLAKYNLDNETIKFIDAGISQSSVWTNYKIINNAKKENANVDSSNRYYIDTIAAGLTFHKEPLDAPDILHYDSSSMVELGRLFGECLINNEIL